MWVDLVQQSKEYSDLYTRRPVVGRKLLVDVEPYNISDAIPDEEEMHVTLHQLCQKGRQADNEYGVRS